MQAVRAAQGSAVAARAAAEQDARRLLDTLCIAHNQAQMARGTSASRLLPLKNAEGELPPAGASVWSAGSGTGLGKGRALGSSGPRSGTPPPASARRSVDAHRPAGHPCLPAGLFPETVQDAKQLLYGPVHCNRVLGHDHCYLEVADPTRASRVFQLLRFYKAESADGQPYPACEALARVDDQARWEMEERLAAARAALQL